MNVTNAKLYFCDGGNMVTRTDATCQPQSRMVTNIELTAWLRTGLGRMKYRGVDGSFVEFRLDPSDADAAVGDDVLCKYWFDDDWSEPTLDYMSLGIDAYRQMFPNGILSNGIR